MRKNNIEELLEEILHELKCIRTELTDDESELTLRKELAGGSVDRLARWDSDGMPVTRQID